MFEDASHPHQGQPVIEKGKPVDKAQGAVILIHGRGASADSIMTLYDELVALEEESPGTEWQSGRQSGKQKERNEEQPESESSQSGRREEQPESATTPSGRKETESSGSGPVVSGLAWMAPQAYHHSWYPYSFLTPVEQNEPGLSSALKVIDELIDKAESAGIPREKVVLAGFSQGACLSLEYAGRNPDRYGGVVALSGGLIGEVVEHSRYQGSMRSTPVFLGCSDIDHHIPEPRVHESAEVFERLEADVIKKIYKGMGHTVNRDELEHVLALLNSLFKKVP